MSNFFNLVTDTRSVTRTQIAGRFPVFACPPKKLTRAEILAYVFKNGPIPKRKKQPSYGSYYSSYYYSDPGIGETYLDLYNFTLSAIAINADISMHEGFDFYVYDELNNNIYTITASEGSITTTLTTIAGRTLNLNQAYNLEAVFNNPNNVPVQILENSVDVTSTWAIAGTTATKSFAAGTAVPNIEIVFSNIDLYNFVVSTIAINNDLSTHEGFVLYVADAITSSNVYTITASDGSITTTLSTITTDSLNLYQGYNLEAVFNNPNNVPIQILENSVDATSTWAITGATATKNFAAGTQVPNIEIVFSNIDLYNFTVSTIAISTDTSTHEGFVFYVADAITSSNVYTITASDGSITTSLATLATSSLNLYQGYNLDIVFSNPNSDAIQIWENGTNATSTWAISGSASKSFAAGTAVPNIEIIFLNPYSITVSAEKTGTDTTPDGFTVDVNTASASTSFSSTLVEGFETGAPTSATSPAQNYTLGSGVWSIIRAASSTTSHSGTESLKISSGNSSQAYATAPALNAVSTVTFWAKASSATTLQVQKSVNGGAYTTVATQSISTTFTQYTINVNETHSDVCIRFNNATSATVYLDDVTISYAGTDISTTAAIVGTFTINPAIATTVTFTMAGSYASVKLFENGVDATSTWTVSGATYSKTFAAETIVPDITVQFNN